MNKSKTLLWWDDEVNNSYLLCLKPYKLKLLREVTAGSENETEITVYGATEDVDRFIEDVEEDSLEPFEEISLQFDECADYYREIKKKISEFIELEEFENLNCSEREESSEKMDWTQIW